MATIINNPSQEGNSGSNGFLIGILILAAIIAIVMFFGIPAMKRADPIEVNLPATEVNVDTPEIVVPDNVDVNVTSDE